MSQRLSFTDQELEYLRYLVSTHAGTELDDETSAAEIEATYKIIDSLRAKLEVR